MKGVLIEALRFSMVGVLNTAVGVGVIFLSISLFGASPILANMMGYVAGLSISFLLNAWWTFDNRISLPSLVRFLITFVASYTLNLIVLVGATLVGVGPYLSQAIAVASYTLAFFGLSKLFVFPRALKPTGPRTSAPEATAARCSPPGPLPLKNEPS